MTQYDLFGEIEADEALATWWRQPGTCPCCGETEPNGYLLRRNHGVDPDGTVCGYQPGEHPVFEGRCVAQDLVTNHITYSARKAAAGEHGAADQLERDKARGRQLGLDVDAIAAAATANEGRPDDKLAGELNNGAGKEADPESAGNTPEVLTTGSNSLSENPGGTDG